MECVVCPRRIIDAQRRAIAVPKIKFGQITMQMFFATMLIDPAHTALENGKEPLGSIGMGIAANILIEPVIDAVVTRKFTTDLAIVRTLVGHEGCFPSNIGPDDRRNI